MEKKEKSLLIWILSMAGVILLVLYSPLGSPGMYVKNNYFVENQGVSFFGKILNAPKKSNIFENSNLIIPGSSAKFSTTLEANNPTIGNEIPLFTNSNINKAKYRVNDNSETNDFQNNANYAVQMSNISNSNKSSTHVGYGNDVLLGYNSYNVSNNNNSNKNSTGFVSMSIDLSLFGESSSNKQTVDYAPNQGGMDPGGVPTGDIIPVGDGWILLLIMAALYAIIRIR